MRGCPNPNWSTSRFPNRRRYRYSSASTIFLSLTHMAHVAEIIPGGGSRPFIEVHGGRCMLARLVPQGEGFRVQPARNWAELEEEAARSVREARGYLLTAGMYPCPPDLARRG